VAVEVPLLAHFAGNDSWVCSSAQRTIGKVIERDQCSYRSFDYAATRHWFAEPSRPYAFNPEASQAAFNRDCDHFALHLSD
jgi:dienelactone hydrolase